MGFLEIIVIVLSASFVLYIFGSRIYKLVKYKTSDTCEECHNNMKRAVKRMKKQNAKNRKKKLKEEQSQ